MTDAELRKLALAATEGPWHSHDSCNCCGVYSVQFGRIATAHGRNPHNAAYIAAAHPQAMIERMDSKKALQAKIDMLMLEYCPDEMTQAQKDEWAANQVPESHNAK